VTAPTPKHDLRKLLDAATPRPWRDPYGDGTLEGPNYADIARVSCSPDYENGGCAGCGVEILPADAALIVAAVNALPRLLDENERLAKALEDIHCLAVGGVDVDPLNTLDRVYAITSAALGGSRG